MELALKVGNELMLRTHQQAVYAAAGAKDEVDYHIGGSRPYSLSDLRILKDYWGRTHWSDTHKGRSYHYTVEGTGDWERNPVAVRLPVDEMLDFSPWLDSILTWTNPFLELVEAPECYKAPTIPSAQIQKIASTIRVTEEMISHNPPMSIENIYEMQRKATARRKVRLARELQWQDHPEWDNECVERGSE